MNSNLLEVSGLHVSAGEKEILHGVDLTVGKDETHVLMGPNGTGKSTLLRILAGNDKSDSGGKITFLKHIRIAFLEQEFAHDPEKDIFTQVMDSSKQFTEGLDDDGLFAYELRVKKFITSFGLQACLLYTSPSPRDTR